MQRQFKEVSVHSTLKRSPVHAGLRDKRLEVQCQLFLNISRDHCSQKMEWLQLSVVIILGDLLRLGNDSLCIIRKLGFVHFG